MRSATNQKDIDRVTRYARAIELNEEGHYTTIMYRRFKQLDKPWPKIKSSKNLVRGWKPLLLGIESKYHKEIAKVLKLEAMAIKELSKRDSKRPVLARYAFPAIIRYFKSVIKTIKAIE